MQHVDNDFHLHLFIVSDSEQRLFNHIVNVEFFSFTHGFQPNFNVTKTLIVEPLSSQEIYLGHIPIEEKKVFTI